MEFVQDRDCGDENDYNPTWHGYIGLLRDHRRWTASLKLPCERAVSWDKATPDSPIVKTTMK